MDKNIVNNEELKDVLYKAHKNYMRKLEYAECEYQKLVHQAKRIKEEIIEEAQNSYLDYIEEYQEEVKSDLPF